MFPQGQGQVKFDFRLILIFCCLIFVVIYISTEKNNGKLKLT